LSGVASSAAWIKSRPVRTARSASSSWAWRIAEVDEHSVAYVFGHEATKTLHCLGNALLVACDDLAQTALCPQMQTLALSKGHMSRLWSQKAFLNSVKTAGTSKGPGRKPSPRPTAPPADKFIKAWMIRRRACSPGSRVSMNRFVLS
jgi:hypothetical protein